MNVSRLLVLAVIPVLCFGIMHAGEATPLPPTPKKPVTTEMHGVKIVDEFRWLENGDDPAVRKWSAEQTQHAREVLDQSPALPALRQRV